MIYLITNREKGICKIGFSNNPEKRLLQLQTGNPYKLTLECTIDGSIDLERELHEQFKSLSLVGEWFKLENSIDIYFKTTESIYMFELVLALDLDKVSLRLINHLVLNCNYNSNVITITNELKKDINLSDGTIRNTLTKLKHSGIIEHLGKSVYRINPLYYWKGELSERQKYLELNYT